MNRANNRGFGKTILCGEHFVVHGLPAIVSALSTSTSAVLCESNLPGLQLLDERPATPGYKAEKRAQQEASLRLMAEALGLNLSARGLVVRLGGDLVAASGVGASAASCTAFARAASSFFGLDLDDARINAVAFEGEKAFHGTPSGIDNTAATYGGLLTFRKDLSGGAPSFTPLATGTPLPIVLADTALTADTSAVVGEVRAFLRANPDRGRELFTAYDALYSEMVQALEVGELRQIGTLMNRNQDLLAELGVSCPEIEELIAMARSNGALGAKLTGTGRGGLVLCLAADERSADTLAELLATSGRRIFRATLG
ncbi:MAG: mevalonate kinase [Deltaproteobacteria bacterium RIFOXYA12_FULL_61_11]|nr:MAG: mevalonate kinase [Deltaproteobacteria bacterium RIFOXYA12_FULL_61_11]